MTCSLPMKAQSDACSCDQKYPRHCRTSVFLVARTSKGEVKLRKVLQSSHYLLTLSFVCNGTTMILLAPLWKVVIQKPIKISPWHAFCILPLGFKDRGWNERPMSCALRVRSCILQILFSITQRSYKYLSLTLEIICYTLTKANFEEFLIVHLKYSVAILLLSGLFFL